MKWIDSIKEAIGMSLQELSRAIQDRNLWTLGQQEWKPTQWHVTHNKNHEEQSVVQKSKFFNTWQQQKLFTRVLWSSGLKVGKNFRKGWANNKCFWEEAKVCTDQVLIFSVIMQGQFSVEYLRILIQKYQSGVGTIIGKKVVTQTERITMKLYVHRSSLAKGNESNPQCLFCMLNFVAFFSLVGLFYINVKIKLYKTSLKDLLINILFFSFLLSIYPSLNYEN